MKTCYKIILSLFCIFLCLSLCACTDGGSEKDTVDTDTPLSAEEAGIVSHGWVSETDFPANLAITEWYVYALEREQITNAILYARDDTDELWHCWLYLGAWKDGDSVTLGADTSNGFRVTIRHTAADTEAVGSTGAVYFTVSAEAEPEFKLYINDSFAGMVATHSATSVTK